MGRYSVMKTTTDGRRRKVGVLRTRHGTPVTLELRESVSGEFDLERYEEDGEPTVSRARRPSGGWTVSDRR